MTTADVPAVHPHYQALLAAGGAVRAPDAALTAGFHAGAVFHQHGQVLVVIEPGNSTVYRVLLTDLARVTQVGQHHGHRPENVVGGPLLVTPISDGHNTWRPCALGLPAVYDPGWLGQQLGMRYGDAAHLAVMLDAFDAGLRRVRGEL